MKNNILTPVGRAYYLERLDGPVYVEVFGVSVGSV